MDDGTKTVVPCLGTRGVQGNCVRYSEEITLDEVRNSLKKMRCGKAPRIDEIAA